MTRRTRLFFLIVAASAAVFFLYAVRDVLTPFALAAGLAYLANPLVNAFVRREMPRHVAIFLVYAIFAIGAGLLIYWLVPAWVRQLNGVLEVLPQAARDIEQAATRWMANLVRLPGSSVLHDLATGAVRRGETLVQSWSARLLDVLLSFVPKAFNLIITPFLAYYILRDLTPIYRGFISLLPTSQRSDVERLLHDINKALSGYLRGQLIVSMLVGAMVALSLAVLQIDYALLIGAVAGLFDIIPYFGPIIGGLPAVALGLLKSPGTALWVVVLLVTVHQIEGVFLQPRIVGGQVGLHPLTVIFAVLAGGKLMGVWGMLLAVPVAGVVKAVGIFLVDKMAGPAPQ